MIVPYFLDPELTYQPRDSRGVVQTQEQEPRKRLRELYHHYKQRGDYFITSRFLRRRDWLELPSRLLKERIL